MEYRSRVRVYLLGSFCSAYGSGATCFDHANETSSFIKEREFLDQVSDCQIID